MNKNKIIISVALLTLWSVPSFAQLSNDNEDRVNKIDARWAKNDYVPGQVLVKFKDNNRIAVRRSQGKFSSTSADKVTAVLQKYGTNEMKQLCPNENPNRQMRRARAYTGEIIQERDLSQLYCLTVSADHRHETMQMIDELNVLEEVEYAEPNYYCYAMGNTYIGGTGVSGNPLLGKQWYLTNYGVRELWDQPIINPERPIIAIIDTGVDTEHPDLKDNCIAGFDFVNYQDYVIDDNMHGTHVAGIAAACNNETGIVGANPQALIMPVKVLDADGSGDTFTILQGVQYAVEHGAKILNLSLGGYGYSKAAADVYRNASLNAIIVAAAGNDGRCIYSSHNGLIKHGIQPAPSFPAAYSFVLGVQATGWNGKLASFSNYDDDGPLYSCEVSLDEPDGFNYELRAPGTEILSTVPDGRYDEMQGTSMASPLVAGAISALMMVKNYESREQLWAELLHTDNIAQAFYLKELPIELDIVQVLIGERTDFTEEPTDYFNTIKEVHAGETIYLYPEVRCTFGEASNIKLTIDVDDNEDPDVVQILTDDVDFGWHLDTFGRAVSKNPLIVKFSEDIADARHVCLKIKVTSDEQDGFKSLSLTFLANNITTIHGNITNDLCLTADRAYYVDDNLSVEEGATLTIEPGTRLEFAEGTSLGSSGILKAQGTPDKPIVFTSRNLGEKWNGIASSNWYNVENYMYMNSDTTLFSLIPTDLTPIKAKDGLIKKVYSSDDGLLNKAFNMGDYIDDWDEDEDLLNKEELIKDPYYLTPFVKRGLKEWNEYCNQFSCESSSEMCYWQFVSFNFNWKNYYHPIDTISYCQIEDASIGKGFPFVKDCIIKNCNLRIPYLQGIRNMITESSNLSFTFEYGYGSYEKSYIGKKQKYWNIINNYYGVAPKYSDLMISNYFNNNNLRIYSDEPIVDHADYPSYLGTSREDFIRPYIYELGNTSDANWGYIDLSNMRTTPVSEAHGIVWKVVVNGKDAQDEYEELAPLGVGKHKFEVYFNRPMNKAVNPIISFGVRDPWTQNCVDEDGSWNEEGTIYTVYKTITGKTSSDGINRIYVRGAEDNEFFPCPYEKTRFNINVQAAGGMATGFAAEASVGRVNLTWDNSHNDIEDAMGYNVYRFSYDKKITIPGRWENGKWIESVEVPDTIRINKKILGIETDEFTDYDVIPNHTYYYLYKVLSTDLREYDVSNIVAATPLTSTLGDANGSGDVDVADVVTTVNYALGMKPDPFVFDAADMNSDKNIDVLDVVGIVQKILNSNGVAAVSAYKEDKAVYTIENGVLYVESPVALGGVHVQLAFDERSKREKVKVASDLTGFEQASAWLTDEDYLLLAYSMNGKTLAPGKHAILYIGDGELSTLRLADAFGHQVSVVNEDATGVSATFGSRPMYSNGIYDIFGRKIVNDKASNTRLPHGIYIINGQKVVK